MLFPLTAAAEMTSALQPLPETSGTELLLPYTVAGEVPDATCTLYVRRRQESQMTAWQEVDRQPVGDNRLFSYRAEPAETLHFRTAVNGATQSECLVITQFEGGADLQFTNVLATMSGFTASLELDTQDPVQGKSALDFQFTYTKDATPAHEQNHAVGIPFNTTIPTDWSDYRYLEFFYKSNVSAPAQLLLLSSDATGAATGAINLPVTTFSETGAEPDQWHSIVVDLDRTLGKPGVRERIQALALFFLVKDLDLSRRNHLQLDDIRLWRSRNVVTTRVKGESVRGTE
jgi:hypothetical protein